MIPTFSKDIRYLRLYSSDVTWHLLLFRIGCSYIARKLFPVSFQILTLFRYDSNTDYRILKGKQQYCVILVKPVKK
jgi:hypothetical protein